MLAVLIIVVLLVAVFGLLWMRANARKHDTSPAAQASHAKPRAAEILR